MPATGGHRVGRRHRAGGLTENLTGLTPAHLLVLRLASNFGGRLQRLAGGLHHPLRAFRRSPRWRPRGDGERRDLNGSVTANTRTTGWFATAITRELQRHLRDALATSGGRRWARPTRHQLPPGRHRAHAGTTYCTAAIRPRNSLRHPLRAACLPSPRRRLGGHHLWRPPRSPDRATLKRHGEPQRVAGTGLVPLRTGARHLQRRLRDLRSRERRGGAGSGHRGAVHAGAHRVTPARTYFFCAIGSNAIGTARTPLPSPRRGGPVGDDERRHPGDGRLRHLKARRTRAARRGTGWSVRQSQPGPATTLRDAARPTRRARAWGAAMRRWPSTEALTA